MIRKSGCYPGSCITVNTIIPYIRLGLAYALGT